MKKYGSILGLVILFLVYGCAIFQEEKEVRPMKLMQITDLHYLSKSLYTDDVIFRELLKSNDGKLIERDEEILDKVIEECLMQKPDAFLLSGDITFNGEMVSLLEVKDKLQRIVDEGIPVLVIPGNHDIDYAYARSYIGKKLEKVATISQEEFKEEMLAFGYSKAISVDQNSLSYLYAIDDTNLILCLDANVPGKEGYITKGTLGWMEEELKRAKADGKQVVVMSHQNVLRQNENIYYGYVIHNEEEVKRILKKYGVKLVLSGHSHIQHVSQEDELVDICSESVVLAPLSYTVVDINENREFQYKKVKLGIYEEEANKRFDECLSKGLVEGINTLEVEESQKERIKEFALMVNRAIFADDQEALVFLRESESYPLWKKHAKNLRYYSYLERAVNEAKMP